MIEGIVLLAAIIYLLWYLGTKNFDYWKAKGVPFLKPQPFVGNLGPLLLGKVSETDHNWDLYKELNGHRYVHLAVEFIQNFIDYERFNEFGGGCIWPKGLAPVIKTLITQAIKVWYPLWAPMC